ncbi:metacaspase 2f, metacaspase 9 [Hibiscus trionum]|uniref:Metacaspase 2f, metacaspase 9 n=1 Tax=Hibiscus trionum TaxID=183268 RepID=A0A9W7H7P1_HIBTR|nr:metacaspase 2f, metacaspase 9 [Hibiscus trionum]
MMTTAREGDVLFFYFSGHGTAIPAFHDDRFVEDEAIVPCDFNIITDTDLREIISQLAAGVSFTILSDS